LQIITITFNFCYFTFFLLLFFIFEQATVLQ
jgi:hypothetical protein